MEDIKDLIKVDNLFIWWLAIKAIDQTTGFGQAFINDNIISGMLRKGLQRVAMEMITMLLIFIVGHIFLFPVDIFTICCAIMILKEVISILENLGKAGIWIPDFIATRLVAVKDLIEGKASE